MSKDKAEEKAREYVSQKLKENGYRNFHGTECVECAYISGYTQSVTDLSTENAQLREALRDAMQALTDISDPITYLRIKMPKEGYSFDLGGAVEFANNGMSISCMAKDALSKLETKAKQLLTDKE